jgi:hypothetical protein
MIKVEFDERKSFMKKRIAVKLLSFFHSCLDCRPQGHTVALGKIYYLQGKSLLPLKQHWPFYQKSRVSKMIKRVFSISQGTFKFI